MRNRIRSIAIVLMALLASQVVAGPLAEAAPSPKEIAERYFRGVYGCNAGVVDDFASEDVVVSYPIIQTIFGRPALRGRVEVRAFAEGFCRKWSDAEFQFHEVIADHDRVVLVWSFSARAADGEPATPRSSWGGISLLRFNDDGRITHELGEESEPGPIGRLEQVDLK